MDSRQQPMLVFRHLISLSATAVIALICGTSATAQSIYPTQSKPKGLPTAKEAIALPSPVSSPPVNNGADLLQTPVNSLPPGKQPANSPAQGVAQSNPPTNSAPVFNLEGTPEKSPPIAPKPLSQEASSPNNLNPSGNPLLFPTNPKQVQIKNVQPVTLNQVIELALKNNKDLQVARLTLDRNKAGLDAAVAALYPTLRADLGYTYNSSNQSTQQSLGVEGQQAQVEQFNQGLANVLNGGTNNPLYPFIARQASSGNSNANQGFNLFNSTIELGYNVYTGGNREANIQKAAKQVQSSQLEVERIAQETSFNARTDYYDLQNADAQVAIAQAAVEDTTQSLRDAQLLEQAGLGTKFDVLRSEVDLARANQALTQAIAVQRTARRKLIQTLSLGQQVELTAADEIKEAGTWPFTLEDSIVKAYKNRAELEQQLVQREISEQDSYIALSAIKPTVNVFLRYNASDTFSAGDSFSDGYAAGTRITWTMFDGGKANAEAQQAYRAMDIANTNFAKQRNEIRFNVERAYYELTANQENIQTTRKNVERATEALRLARLRFQAGVGTQTDVINAQRDLTDARSQFLQAIIGYNKSLSTLQRQVSNLPEGKLFQFQ